MSEYFLLITDAGKALEVQAHASGVPVNLTEFAVGDGGGDDVTPDTSQTTLVNETFRDVISSLSPDAEDSSVLQAECIIPSDSGGYTIREIGIYAEDGTLYAVGNYAEQIKPDPESGFAASLQIMAQLAVSDVADISLTVRDGSYLTETQADTLYLRQDQQLAEIEAQGAAAQQAAQGHLGLRTAATCDAQTSITDVTAGRLMQVGAFGIGGPEINIPDGTDIYKYFPTAKSGNYGGGGDLVNTSTSSGWHGFKWQQHGGDSKYGFLIEAIGNSQMALHIYNNPTGDMINPQNYWTNSGVFYSPKNKPTAADVGAIPLSGSNAVTGTIRTTGEFQSTNPRAFRLVNGSYGSFWYQDGMNMYLMLTNSGDPYGSYNTLRPFRVGLDTGLVVLAETSVNGKVTPTDYGNFDARYYTQSAGNAKFVAGFRLGTRATMGVGGGLTDAPTGCVLTGGGDFGADDGSYSYRPAQYLLNGSWVTASNLSATALLNLETYPLDGITILSRLKLTANESTLRDEHDLDWYRARDLLSGNHFIAFDPDTGVIRQIDEAVDMLWPVNLSVTGVETLPDNCSIDGSWIFDGTGIIQSTDLLAAQTLQKNTDELQQRLHPAVNAAFMIQSSIILNTPREGDEDNLLALQQYADALRDVDLTASEPDWPETPSFL